MKDKLLQQFDEYLEKQDMLNKLTEQQKLNEYGYSEIHTICYIETLKEPNVTQIARKLKMTRGAVSKIAKKLQSRGLIEAYMLPENNQKVLYRLTDKGRELYDAHEIRHNLWLERDNMFLGQFTKEELLTIGAFMEHYNQYLEKQIEELSL